MNADTQKDINREPKESVSAESWDPNRSEVTINIDELGPKSGNSFEYNTRLEFHKNGQRNFNLGSDMVVLQAQTEKRGSDEGDKKEAPGGEFKGGPGINYVAGKNEFVFKVFLAVLVMLAIIMLLTLIFMLTPIAILLPNVITTFIFFLIGGCCAKDLICAVVFWTRIRRTPYIYFCLVLSVIFYTLLITGFGAYFNTAIVLGSVFTLILVAGAAMFMAFLKVDFTKIIIVIAAALLALVVMLIIVGLVTGFIILGMNVFIPPLIVVLQAVLFIVEMQIILEGRTIDVNETEHYLGAYLVCNSFLEIKYNLLFRLLNRRLGF